MLQEPPQNWGFNYNDKLLLTSFQNEFERKFGKKLVLLIGFKVQTTHLRCCVDSGEGGDTSLNENSRLSTFINFIPVGYYLQNIGRNLALIKGKRLLKV